MPPETSSTDRYLAEIDRLLDLRGCERHRALAAARRRLARLEKEERRRGASDAEAHTRALASLGQPEQVAQEVHEWTLARRARVNAQAVLAASIPILLAIAAIALKALEVRRFRQNGEISIQESINENVSGDGFFHHFRALDIYLPPRYLSLKLALSAFLIVIALVLAESALAFVQRRRRLGAGLTLAGGAALVAAVSLQIALAFEWHRLHQGHDAWLLAAILVEVGAVLLLAVFLVRATRTILAGRLAPLARAPIFALLVLAPILAVGAKSGLSSTDLCTPSGSCGLDPEQVIEFTSGHPVNVSLLAGPAGSQGAVALKGRRLAFVASAWRKQTKGTREMEATGKRPVDLAVWEGRWPASLPGPCGATMSLTMDRLAPKTEASCDILDPRSHPGTYWKIVASLPESKARAVAIAYRSNGRLAVAYSRPGGVYIAESPSWRPKRVLATGAESVRLVPLAGGDLALAAIVSGPGGSELELSRSYIGHWSRSISVVAQPGLSMVSGGSQIALVFRDRAGRLVLERRTDDLALLQRRSFSTRARGALGSLRGGKIGVAVADPLRGHALRLRLFRASGKALILLARERVSTYKPVAIPITSATTTGVYQTQVDRKTLTGVVQIGRVVRALYDGNSYGHAAEHVFVSFYLGEGRPAFVSDWPRWAVLQQTTQEETRFRKPDLRWTSFNLILFQPPAAQLK